MLDAAHAASEVDGAGSLPTTLLRDTADILRQCLDELLWDLARLFEGAFHRNEPHTAAAIRATWREVAMAMDAVQSTDVNQLLGVWIRDARAIASSTFEESLLEYNARNQITLWGPSWGITDYAQKHWSGLIATYYVRGRWDILFTAAMESLKTRIPINQTAIDAATLAYEVAWVRNYSEVFTTIPTANPLNVLDRVANQYFAKDGVGASYSKHTNVDVPSLPTFELLPQPAYAIDIGALAFLCSADPACRGFNSKGWLKAGNFSLAGLQPSPGCDFYAKVVEV